MEYCPDCDGACTVSVTMMVPGTTSPMETDVLVDTLHPEEAPLTVSLQLRNENFEKSPPETMVALL